MYIMWYINIKHSAKAQTLGASVCLTAIDPLILGLSSSVSLESLELRPREGDRDSERDREEEYLDFFGDGDLDLDLKDKG